MSTPQLQKRLVLWQPFEAVLMLEYIFLFGELNARVGDDNTSWAEIIGSFGWGKPG